MPVALFLSGGLLTEFTAHASWKDVASSVYNAQVKPIAVGAMLVVWMLSRLDPVAIIERR